MKNLITIGIRREDKNIWEKRVPLSPKDVGILIRDHAIQVVVQPSLTRTFPDQEYIQVGAHIQEDLSECDIIVAVKEIPKELFLEHKTYLFFSHVIKGQPYNMPMLKMMIDKKVNLIDYERIVDEQNKRLIFFGNYAGLAGMIDAIWAIGARWVARGVHTPFKKIWQANEYRDLEQAKAYIEHVGYEIAEHGFPQLISPVVVGFSGYGNVSKGAQSILDLLPVKEVIPEELPNLPNDNKCIYKVVFKEQHMVKRKDDTQPFDLQEYYNEPEKYESLFNQYLPYLTILMNCIYWDTMYPRLITKSYLMDQANQLRDPLKLELIGDISCDIHGAIEFTEKATEPDNPVFTYLPKQDQIVDGFDSNGITNLAIDNLPAELPKESSAFFGNILKDFLPILGKTDFSVPFDILELPDHLKQALILHQGSLTPAYKYLHEYIN